MVLVAQVVQAVHQGAPAHRVVRVLARRGPVGHRGTPVVLAVAEHRARAVQVGPQEQAGWLALQERVERLVHQGQVERMEHQEPPEARVQPVPMDWLEATEHQGPLAQAALPAPPVLTDSLEVLVPAGLLAHRVHLVRAESLAPVAHPEPREQMEALGLQEPQEHQVQVGQEGLLVVVVRVEPMA